MIFSASPIILIIPTNLVNLETARETYGVTLPLRPADPQSPHAKTLLAYLDREGSSDLRAGVIGETACGISLINGYTAFIGFFAQAFLDAINTDPLLAGCSVVNENDFMGLLPTLPGDL